MHLLVGLGNPGPKYALTRHNIGFMLVDALAYSFSAQFRDEHKAKTCRIQHPNGKDEVLLAKPQTFMNLSGESVQALMSYYKISLDKLVVAHDEVDLPFGRLKLQKNRGPGGHNGIRDIHQRIGPEYCRLRMGVGRPAHPQMQVVDYVLQKFSDDELKLMPEFLENSADAILNLLDFGFEKVQNKIKQFNQE